MNDIDDPTAKVLTDGGGAAFVSTNEKLKCSNVQRNFINEESEYDRLLFTCMHIQCCAKS